ncbi:hypothetical protein D3C77_707250 [compost metagenome]
MITTLGLNHFAVVRVFVDLQLARLALLAHFALLRLCASRGFRIYERNYITQTLLVLGQQITQFQFELALFGKFGIVLDLSHPLLQGFDLRFAALILMDEVHAGNSL